MLHNAISALPRSVSFRLAARLSRLARRHRAGLNPGMPPSRAATIHRVLRVALLLFFAWLMGRFWHPHYGFTRFLMMDTASAAATLPELRTAPIFLYPDGYDGHYYAQLAARPLVNDPALAGAVDAVPYRARRILLSWTAWAVAGGDPVQAVRTYAWLNLVLWGALAALLWRLLPCTGCRETAAWAGILFSAGVLHSVRLALTDLLALVMITGAVMLAERGRRGPAAMLLGLGGLARETVLLGAVALLPRSNRRTEDRRQTTEDRRRRTDHGGRTTEDELRRTEDGSSPRMARMNTDDFQIERDQKTTRGEWLKAAGWGLVVAVPLALWLVYLGSKLGWDEPGVGNFMLPVAGFAGKWMEAIRRLKSEPDQFLAMTTLLAHMGLTVQALYIVTLPKWRDSWWRLGAVYVGLMLVLGTAVWEGHPGAATRVLLPLALAFNVLAVRARAAGLILALGNLSVLSGVLVCWQVPPGQNELAAGRFSGGSYVVHTEARWYPIERWKGQSWSWSANGGGLLIDMAPRLDGQPRTLWLDVRGMNARNLEIHQGDRLLWRGDIGEKRQAIELTGVEFIHGRAELVLRSPAEPRSEGGENARKLGFAVYGVRVE